MYIWWMWVWGWWGFYVIFLLGWYDAAAKASFGEQEWYFFSPRDRKYPNGARPNRAATSGYWKATGTDKPVLAANGNQKVGVKKALVFYGGKPPRGIKTNWIMHEYRLVDNKPNNKPPGCDLPNKKNSLRVYIFILHMHAHLMIYMPLSSTVRFGFFIHFLIFISCVCIDGRMINYF